jgi:hypothetical protein
VGTVSTAIALFFGGRCRQRKVRTHLAWKVYLNGFDANVLRAGRHDGGAVKLFRGRGEDSKNWRGVSAAGTRVVITTWAPGGRNWPTTISLGGGSGLSRGMVLEMVEVGFLALRVQKGHARIFIAKAKESLALNYGPIKRTFL